MFTLKDVNDEIIVFNKYMNSQIPFIEEIILMEDINTQPHAKVQYDDLINHRYILYLNKRIEKYDIKFQTSLLWHEFTHIYDFISYQSKYDKIREMMKSYSESHAISVQVKFLFGLKLNENLKDFDTKIPYQDKEYNIGELCTMYVNSSCSYMNNYIQTKDFICFNYALDMFLGFCGCLLVLENPIEIFSKTMTKYVEVIYKNQLLLLGNAILSHDVYGTYEIYNKISVNALLTSLKTNQ